VTASGEVTEGTTSNLFAVVRGRLLTPPAAAGVLGGVTRDLVRRLADRAGLPQAEGRLRVTTLARASEIFVTASTIEIIPVVRLDAELVGMGTVGPVTRLLQQRYRAHVRRSCARSRRRR